MAVKKDKSTKVATKKTKEVKSTKATSSKKVIKDAKKASEAKAVQIVIMNKPLKYIYPEDIMNDKPKMKTFRAKVRRTLEKMEAKASKLRGQKKKDHKVEYNDYRAQVLVNPEEA